MTSLTYAEGFQDYNYLKAYVLYFHHKSNCILFYGFPISMRALKLEASQSLNRAANHGA